MKKSKARARHYLNIPLSSMDANTEYLALEGAFPITPGEWERMLIILEAMKKALVQEEVEE